MSILLKPILVVLFTLLFSTVMTVSSLASAADPCKQAELSAEEFDDLYGGD